MKYLFFIFGGILVIFLVMFGAGKVITAQNLVVEHLRQNDHLGLVVEPAEGIAPVLNMLKNASTSVDLVMYEMDDEQIERALVAAKDRGVAVRVLLNEGYQGQSATFNQRAYDYFQANGVSVKWAPSYFALTHEKALVVDHDAAMIMTFNLTPRYYATSRDFGIRDEDRADVAAVEAAFDADWQGNDATASPADDLVWSPHAEDATLAFINAATSTLDIYNEEMADQKIIGALEDAARRGVAVRVDMTYQHEWSSAFRDLSSAGVEIGTYPKSAPLYIHAKMILADSRVASVGSQNFSETSQDENRELGIIVSDPKIVATLASIFAADWQNANQFSP